MVVRVADIFAAENTRPHAARTLLGAVLFLRDDHRLHSSAKNSAAPVQSNSSETRFSGAEKHLVSQGEHERAAWM